MTVLRLSALFVSAAALIAFVLQTGVDLYQGQPLLDSLWKQARYFTNLTICAVVLIYVWTAFRGWPGQSLPAGLTVWIALTGVIYHALLAATHHPEGLDVIVNFLQHTGVPIAAVLLWWAFAPKDRLGWWDAVIWVAYPLGYLVYAIGRGLADGTFPYFFLNPDKIGWGGVFGWVLGIGALFLASGLLVVFAAVFQARRRQKLG